MYTQCPHCQTCFRIAEDHLKVANGKVRCGSCQEVFDATQHLFKNLTDREPITDFKQPAPAPAATPPARTPPHRSEAKPTPAKPVSPPPRPTATEDIDLSATPPSTADNTLEEIRRERANAPKQDHFMESTIGNDRYNDLDKMGSISIPGSIDFGDSFIKFPDEEEKDTTESVSPEPASRTPYEDLESQEAAATTADHDSIKNFYAQVDAELNGEEFDDRSQLDKDIDELLAFAKDLEANEKQAGAEQTKPAEPEHPASQQPDNELEEEFDLQAIADFEKELETTNSGVFAAQDLVEEHHKQETAKNKTPDPGFKPNRPDKVKTEDAIIDELPSAPETDQAKQAGETALDELPSPEEDIPLALRRSLDGLNQLPQRSLGQTLLMLLVILILIGGLGFQVVLFRSVALAHAFPNLAPVLSKVCDSIPCRYSGNVDVSQIKLLSRDVRSHPTQANALLISAAFVNQAPFDQPYPNILITLYDLGGNVVASRRFTPQEYLAQMYNRFLLMESGTPVHVTLAVLDPGKDAINFEFSFQ